MTNINTAAARPAVVVKGKGATARKTAFTHIAVDSYMADTSRLALVATLRLALGDAPTVEQVDYAKGEYVIGRMASRLPAGEFPKGCTTAIDKITFCNALFYDYATPTTAKAGKVPALRKGKIGWRSAIQQRVLMNALESWSQVKADLGLGTAKTDRDKAKDKANRNPTMSKDAAKGAAKPNHTELVQPAKDMTQDEVCAYVMQQASMLLQFSNKNAKKMPAAYGAAIQAFKSAINKAANELALAKAAADAKAAEKQAA